MAKLANVSVASASRALNGIGTRPETLAQVLEAAERVGYVPNASARSLRSKRTGQIAFAMPDVANPVYASMARTIQEVAHERGIRLVLHSTGADAEEELGILRDLRRRFVDGLILVPLDVTAEHLIELGRAASPVVVIGSIPGDLPIDAVGADSRRGAALAVKHLHERGRRRIALVNGPVQTTPGHARRLGYLDGLRAVKQKRDDDLCEAAGEFSIEAGRAATVRLLARARPDGLLCANDLLAAGAIDALRSAGHDVPKDVAVVGMDNSELAQITWPALTSVDLGSVIRAHTAVELLLDRIEDPARAAERVHVEAALCVRASSGEEVSAR
ncbi:MAG: LacI family DNA-binding transcriptional regulator [Actinomycetota bacterium]